MTKPFVIIAWHKRRVGQGLGSLGSPQLLLDGHTVRVVDPELVVDNQRTVLFLRLSSKPSVFVYRSYIRLISPESRFFPGPSVFHVFHILYTPKIRSSRVQ